MIGKLRRLLGHPGFRAAPIAVLGRCVTLAWALRRGRAPRFRLVPGGPLVEVPADWRYTTVANYLMREHAEPELAALHRFLSAGDVLVDVGANIGLFTLLGAHLVGPGGRVLAVEPGRVSIGRLEANLALNTLPQVSLVRAALADAPGEMALYHVALGDDPQAYSLLSDGSDMAREMVQVTTLDRLAEAEGLTRLDCIKIDVEGAEPMVLAGGEATLARFRPIIIFEVNAPIGLGDAEGADSASAAFAALRGLGYTMFRLEGAALTPCARPPREHGNLIAIHPEGRQARFQRA
jgi:FkbM family methyltransferase